MKFFTALMVFLFVVTTFYFAQAKEIEAQNVEVIFLASDDISFKRSQNLKENPTPIFNQQYSAPGDTFIKYIKVINNGSRKIEYKINFDVIETSMIENIIYFNIEKINGESEQFLASQLEMKELTNILNADDDDIYKITIHLYENAGNEYNGKNKFKFDIICNYQQAFEHQFIPLCGDYYGSLHSRNWVRVGKECGLAEMKFPKIYSGNAWKVINGKLTYEGEDVEENGSLYAGMGIKTNELLAKYPGYHVTSVTVNDYELINLNDPSHDQWIESTHDWDIKKGFTHQINLQIGKRIEQGNYYQLEELTHIVKITISNHYDLITFTLNVEVGELGNKK